MKAAFNFLRRSEGAYLARSSGNHEFAFNLVPNTKDTVTMVTCVDVTLLRAMTIAYDCHMNVIDT